MNQVITPKTIDAVQKNNTGPDYPGRVKPS
jgi:hypothetical protein